MKERNKEQGYKTIESKKKINKRKKMRMHRALTTNSLECVDRPMRDELEEGSGKECGGLTFYNTKSTWDPSRISYFSWNKA